MKDKGKIVESRILESGKTMKFLAGKLDVTTRTLRNWLDSPNLDWAKISRIGRIISHDFSGDFPDLRKELSLIEEPETKYQTRQEFLGSDCQEIIDAKNQVIAAKDEQIRMMKEFADNQMKMFQDLIKQQETMLSLKMNA